MWACSGWSRRARQISSREHGELEMVRSWSIDDGKAEAGQKTFSGGKEAIQGAGVKAGQPPESFSNGGRERERQVQAADGVF